MGDFALFLHVFLAPRRSMFLHNCADGCLPVMLFHLPSVRFLMRGGTTAHLWLHRGVRLSFLVESSRALPQVLSTCFSFSPVSDPSFYVRSVSCDARLCFRCALPTFPLTHVFLAFCFARRFLLFLLQLSLFLFGRGCNSFFFFSLRALPDAGSPYGPSRLADFSLSFFIFSFPVFFVDS